MARRLTIAECGLSSACSRGRDVFSRLGNPGDRRGGTLGGIRARFVLVGSDRTCDQCVDANTRLDQSLAQSGEVRIVQLHGRRAFAAAHCAKSPGQLEPVAGNRAAFGAFRHELGDCPVRMNDERKRASSPAFIRIVREHFDLGPQVSLADRRHHRQETRRTPSPRLCFWKTTRRPCDDQASAATGDGAPQAPGIQTPAGHRRRRGYAAFAIRGASTNDEADRNHAGNKRHDRKRDQAEVGEAGLDDYVHRSNIRAFGPSVHAALAMHRATVRKGLQRASSRSREGHVLPCPAVTKCAMTLKAR